MVWALPLACGKRSGFSPFRTNRAPFFRSLTVAPERACGSWLQSLTQEGSQAGITLVIQITVYIFAFHHTFNYLRHVLF